MEEVQYHHHHHHHHHHHGQDANYENQGQQYTTSPEGAIDSVVTQYQQQQQQENLSIPIGVPNTLTNQILGGVQTAGSFHSVSSVDSAAEMAKYFPDVQTPNLVPFSYQQGVEGQAQSTATSETVVTTNISTVNAGPYIPVSAPTAVQQLSQPLRAPFMAQQQQRPVRPPLSGIPSYSSQIEGLSVSQAVVNDVLVDLQSKVINESLQQYQDESSSGTYLEPLPPIYIRAPQPTIILRSDLHRLRAELNSRVRPPVIHRHPAGANQFQQNTFQAPRFPVPPQQYVPPGYYGDYQNAPYATSDEYKTTATTTGDEHRKENEERLYDQAESPVLNNDNINDNVHSTFDLQGLSTTSFDRHASPYQSSSFLPNLEDQQQGSEVTAITSSHHFTDEEVGRTDNMFSRPAAPRQEINFDINNCIFRCFEAHRQAVARRRAARQARKARRHKQSGQQQQQQLHPTDQHQNFPTQPTYSSLGNIEQSQWEQQVPTSAHYSDVIPGPTNTSTSVHTSQGPYVPTASYDYTNLAQTSSLPVDIQQYQSPDIVNIHTSQIPFSSLSATNIDATGPTDLHSSGTDYYQYKTYDAQEPYAHSNTFEYASHQAVPSTTDFVQQPPIEQQQQQQAQTSFDYSSQLPYSSYTSADSTVLNETQHLTSEYYQQQQQQVPTQFIQNQGTYAQPPGTFDYTAGSTQAQVPSYDYPNIEQQSYQYPYNAEKIQTEQKQTFDYSNQALNSSDYHQQQQPIPVPVPQTQGAYSQPTGTFEYTRESYQSQEPIYDYQGTDQQSSEYSYNVGDNQQIPQQDSYNYASTATNTYAPSQVDVNPTGQRQTFDYSNQGLSSSDYYQQQPISVSTSQVHQTYAQPSETFDYTKGSAQSQEPFYKYQDVQQNASRYPYNIGNIEQQSFDYTGAVPSAYVPPETTTQQIKQNQTFDYSSQGFDSSNYYQQPPIPASASQVQGSYSQPTGTFEYTRESYQSQEPIYDYQGAGQQSSPYSYNLEGVPQQQPQQQEAYNYASDASATYATSETDIQRPDQNQTFDYSSQVVGSSDHYQQQSVPIPVTQTYDSQLLGQRVTGASIPTGTVEYTREAYYSQEPLPDNYTTETYIEQHQQQQQENQSFNVNDYLKQFESETYPQQSGGQLQSSADDLSSATVTTTPFIIQPNVDIHSSQGATQTYNLQNYTNEPVVLETSQPPLTSSIHEEDQQHLLRQPDQHSEIYTSINDTYSTLPPVLRATKEYQQESVVTNTSEFPPPPTPDRHTYQITQQRPSRLHTSIIPSTDQPSIYTEHQPLQPTSTSSSDHRTDDDTQEEVFDLRRCIANCYAKYQVSWNEEEQRKYEQQIQGSQQPISDANIINNQQFGQYQQINTNRQEQPQQYLGTGEIHFTDNWSQTPSLNVITPSNIVQHKYDEIPSSSDTKTYIPYIPTTDLSTDIRGQQTIEYSPPLATQTRHTIPTIPSSPYGYTQYEQQQQQQQQQPPIYDHTLPVPPHLSFNDTDYQPNLYFSSQITAQPRPHQNIPFDIDEQQQQRYRAYSEPASIQQDSITSIPPVQPAASQIFDQQTRRAISIPMIHQQQTQNYIPPVRLLDNGRSYETEAIFERRIPRIDPKTGLCLVPCPQVQKYAHLPPHLRPELFCVELPPPGSLPPVPPPPPPPPPVQQQQQRWCVRCCCVPGQSLIKKVVYKQAEEEQNQEVEYDYASVIDQMATRINVRYGNSIMEEGDAFVAGNYHEQLRITDFPVYVSGKNDPNLTPLVPVN